MVTARWRRLFGSGLRIDEGFATENTEGTERKSEESGVAALDYATPDAVRAKRKTSLGARLLIAGVMASAYVLWGLAGEGTGAGWFFLIGLLGWGAIAIIWSIARRRIGRGEMPERELTSTANMMLLLLALGTIAGLPFTFRSQRSCSHGQMWDNNWIGVARSTSGVRNDILTTKDDVQQAWYVGGGWYLYIPPEY